MRKEKTCWSIADLTSIHAALSQISAGTCAFCTEGESHNNKSAAPNGSGCAHSCIKHAYDTTEQERRNEKLKVQHSSPPPRSAVHAHTKRQKTHPLICFKGAITRYLLSPFKESLNVFLHQSNSKSNDPVLLFTETTFRHWKCFLSSLQRIARMDMDWNAMLAKITRRNNSG